MMPLKHRVFLGIGSNLNKKHNINACMQLFQASFRQCQFSPIYQSPAYGFDGNDFYNLVVNIHTSFTVNSLKTWLIEIENAFGRDRNKPRFSNRTLDIDILLFNTDIIETTDIIIPRPEILKQAYVLKPLVDLAPHMKHPKTNQILKQHWQELSIVKKNSINEVKPL